MIIRKKHIIFVICICSALLISFYVYTIIRSSRYIKETSTLLLEESLKTYIKTEKANTYFSISNYKHNPNDIGKYEEKIIESTDTTFTFKYKIVDYETHVFRSIQTLLLETDKLSADKINIIFDSICHANRIYVNSSIGITANFYKKVNLLSRDTTNMAIAHKTALTNQGEYEDINYHAYMEITPYTYWRLIPKAALYTIIGIIFTIFIIYKTRKYKKRKETIKNLNDKTQPLIDIEKLTKQQQTIISMFLNTADNRVKKETIKEILWPNHKDSTTNMTTAIKRLKDVLEKYEYGYTINTYNEDESFYILEKIESKK